MSATDDQTHDILSSAREEMLRSANKAAAETAIKQEQARRKSEIDMESARAEMIRAMNQQKAAEAAELARKEKMEETMINMQAVDARTQAQEEMLRLNSQREVEQAVETERGRRMSAINMKDAQEEMLRNAARSKAQGDLAAASEAALSNTGPSGEHVSATKSVFADVAKQARKN